MALSEPELLRQTNQEVVMGRLRNSVEWRQGFPQESCLKVITFIFSRLMSYSRNPRSFKPAICPSLIGEQLDHHISHESCSHRPIVAIGVRLVAGKHIELTSGNVVGRIAEHQGQAAFKNINLLAPAIGIRL